MGKRIFYAVCIACIIFGLYCAVNTNDSTSAAVFIVFGAVGLFVGNKVIKYDENVAKVNNALTKADCNYNEKEKTLYVRNRNPEYKNLLSIKPHELKTYNYVPASYVYTGATVGGVTTGGVHKQGDYYKQKSYNSNYELIYPYGCVVERIRLSNDLLKEADHSAINEYLVGNTIRVVDEVKVSDLYVMLQKSGQTDAALTQLESDTAASYPTREKCEKIIKWLSENN